MELKKAKVTRNPNFQLIPVNQLKINKENMDFFNLEVSKCRGYHSIIRTEGGKISRETRLPAYDIRYTKSCVELTVLDKTGFFRIQFRSSGEKKEDTVLSGHKSFLIFKKMCLDCGIDLNEYSIENGEELKKEIEPYIIKMEKEIYKDKTFVAHHLDFHSSFPSGLVLTHPEFRPVIETLYNGRKNHPEYKLILNSTIGYMQSVQCCKARWANLSRDAINNNNERLRTLARRLQLSGRKILAYNTDGIWYIGDVYHDQDEGPGIGNWANDHINCKIRFKSAGAYEFIENGVYTPVVRGHTLLDDKKPRSEWVWGDIYQNDAEPLRYGLDELGYIHQLEGDNYEKGSL